MFELFISNQNPKKFVAVDYSKSLLFKVSPDWMALDFLFVWCICCAL